MKRFFSIALILALMGTAPLASASAEQVEVVSENVDAEVAPAELTGDLGLIVDDGASFNLNDEMSFETDDAEEEEDADEETIEEDDAEQAPEAGDAEEAPAEDGDEEEDFDLIIDEAEEEESEQEAAGDQVANVFLNITSINIGLNETYEGLSVLPDEYGVIPAVTWSSSNTKYVTVNADTGAITGVKRGSATVYATLEDGGSVGCKVTVKKAPSKISINPTALTLSAGGMVSMVTPSLGSDYASGRLVYASSNPFVAGVADNGMVVGFNPGVTDITVSTYNGKKATCKVTVTEAPASVSFAADFFFQGVGETIDVGIVSRAADGTEVPANYVYAIAPDSPDPGCVTFDLATGKATAVREGQAVLFVATHNGLCVGCWLNVVAAPEAVKLNYASGTIGVKEVYTGLRAELVAPADALYTAGAVTWSSSNSKVATVDARTGAITGVAKGTATITATTYNGKKASCKVTVKKAPSKIAISPASASLTVGETGQYKVSFSSGAGGSVSYTSSNPAVAAVDDSGKVTALAAGTTTITATTYNGKTSKSTLAVKSLNSAPPQDSGAVESTTSEYSNGMTNAEKLEYVIYVAQSKLGKPYVYGSFGPNSFDCSGFTTYCFRQIDIDLKHSAYTQGYDNSLTQVSMGELRRGDLVYFNTVDDDDLSDHAGIYLGGGKFIHASSSAGNVIISNLASGYYNRVFSWGRRVFD